VNSSGSADPVIAAPSGIVFLPVCSLKNMNFVVCYDVEFGRPHWRKDMDWVLCSTNKSFFCLV
jgi:hypothetical protein